MHSTIVKPPTIAEHAIESVRLSGGQPVDNPHPPGTREHLQWQAAHDRAIASDNYEGSVA